MFMKSFFLWQDRKTLTTLDKRFSVYACCIARDTSMVVSLKLWKVVWHFSWLMFILICPFRSNIVIWNSSLSATVRPDHMCGYSYLEIQKSQIIRVYAAGNIWIGTSNIYEIKKDSQIKSNGGLSVKMIQTSSLIS